MKGEIENAMVRTRFWLIWGLVSMIGAIKALDYLIPRCLSHDTPYCFPYQMSQVRHQDPISMASLVEGSRRQGNVSAKCSKLQRYARK